MNAVEVKVQSANGRIITDVIGLIGINFGYRWQTAGMHQELARDFAHTCRFQLPGQFTKPVGVQCWIATTGQNQIAPQPSIRDRAIGNQTRSELMSGPQCIQCIKCSYRFRDASRRQAKNRVARFKYLAGFGIGNNKTDLTRQPRCADNILDWRCLSRLISGCARLWPH